MGRVRRYKKYKAVDPFARKKASAADLEHDDPPELHAERG